MLFIQMREVVENAHDFCKISTDIATTNGEKLELSMITTGFPANDLRTTFWRTWNFAIAPILLRSH